MNKKMGEVSEVTAMFMVYKDFMGAYLPTNSSA